MKLIVLLIFYYLFFCPLSLIYRLFRRDTIFIKPDTALDSYWSSCDARRSQSYKKYMRQQG